MSPPPLWGQGVKERGEGSERARGVRGIKGMLYKGMLY